MAKRKKKEAMFENVPFNILVPVILAVFLGTAGLTMFYAQNNLVFPHKESYNSLQRAARAVDSKFKNLNSGKPEAEINGILYPVVAAIVYLAAGASNTIPLIYIIAFAVFCISAAMFYKISRGLNGEEVASASVILYVLTAPVALGILSGADVMLVFLLLSLNAYYSYTALENKKFTGALITGVLLLFTTSTGAAFGIASLSFTVLKMNQSKLRKNYWLLTGILFGVSIAAGILILAKTFIARFDMGYLQSHGILNTKTFLAGTFFADGFLWSRHLPVFFALFFYIALFLAAAEEVRAKKASFGVYAVFITAQAVLMEVMSVFKDNAKTILFVAPFYFILVLFGVNGIKCFAGLIQDKKSGIFTYRNILWGLLVFMILYSVVFTFNEAVQTNNQIQHILSSGEVRHFIQR